jgi:hypothetical protein
VVCKECAVDYPSEENTPVNPTSTDKYIEEKQQVKDNISEQVNSTEEKSSVNKENNSDTSKSSIIDDFGNIDCEMPDYTGGDD